jgi:ATP-dependent DNA helicase RecQ
VSSASAHGEWDISLYEHAQATDIRPLVIETVITNLELAGVLRPLGSFYASYQWRLLKPETSVLAGHTPQRQAFLRRLLHCGKRGTKWTTLTPDEAAAELAEPRDRILKALTWLADAGGIELKPSGSRQRYRLDGPPEKRDPERLAESMQHVFAAREARDVERLQGVIDFAGHRGCLTRRLLHYFGEEFGNGRGDEPRMGCGSCSSCEEDAATATAGCGVALRDIPASAVPPITAEQISAVRGLIAEGHSSLGSPRQLARFLCGLTSPATTRERLGRHAAFGLLVRAPFAEVLSQAELLLGSSNRRP